uniref:Enoyl reductase (ER) domain-containing protein n=1 Tax=Chromera velia CCMP2878 TaxID=1169474 RepID=A0A0G4HZR0_9ALVE|eukprot:Cvel_34096.t1-p1 / transcript=Cvel_34096.t1 / gene=Cvel_34096 / organism=Chromera_velia_CCMP2878 / gene_product=Quinone oxidoreductase PIG3, putative / transcript_product=Quinone oxidoreductase PIG3, putative / location=Cvel_scaffold5743:1918-2901(+) / protein_length=328 / sequence_SO=supercontig / SO=protein_coding / is_pseudo=false
MRAVQLREFGAASLLYVGSADVPVPKAGEVLLRVKATAVNRADCMQRQGKYPPPKGESEILGLEAAGVVEQPAGAWKVGDRVIALLQGGGYAEQVAVPAPLCMPLPEGMSFVDGACIPEAWLTAFQHLHFTAGVEAKDSVLVHAGASGVGTAAIQLAKMAGAKVVATAGSDEKCNFCTKYGADVVLNYKTLGGKFGTEVREATEGKGVSIILDCVGASYFSENAKAAAVDCRWINYAFLGGSQLPDGTDLRWLFGKRVNLHFSTLRSRSLAYRESLVSSFASKALPGFLDGRLRVVLDSKMPLDEVQKAHERMESNENKGKIVLTVEE